MLKVIQSCPRSGMPPWCHRSPAHSNFRTRFGNQVRFQDPCFCWRHWMVYYSIVYTTVDRCRPYNAFYWCKPISNIPCNCWKYASFKCFRPRIEAFCWKLFCPLACPLNLCDLLLWHRILFIKLD